MFGLERVLISQFATALHVTPIRSTSCPCVISARKRAMRVRAAMSPIFPAPKPTLFLETQNRPSPPTSVVKGEK